MFRGSARLVGRLSVGRFRRARLPVAFLPEKPVGEIFQETKKGV